MALTITNTIYPIMGAKNPISYQITTDNMEVTAGVAAVLLFNCVDVPTAGTAGTDSVNIIINGNTYTFTASASPDNTGTQYLVQAAGFTDFAPNMIAALKSNAFFLKNYTFANGGNSFQLTAINTGSQYNMGTFTAIGGLYSNMTQSDTTSGVDEVLRPNMTCILDLYISGEDTPIIELQQPFIQQSDGSWMADFRLEAALYAQLGVDLPTTDIFAAACSNIIQQYYITYCESYSDTINDDPITQKFYSTQATYSVALKAGLAFKDWIPAYINNALSQIPTTNQLNKFLTQQPRTKLISQYSPEWLYFYNPTSEVLEATVTITYTDATTTTSTLTLGDIDKGIWSLYCGYQWLVNNGFISSGKTVLKYTFHILAGSGTLYTLTEIFTFLVSQKTYAYNYYLLFQNSLGGMDTLWLVGGKGYSAENVSTQGQLIIPSAYNAYDAEIIETQKTKQDVNEWNTGPKPKAFIDYINKELPLSEYIYSIDGLKYTENIEISIAEGYPWYDASYSLTRLTSQDIKQMPTFKDDDGLYSMAFKLRTASLDRAYSGAGNF